GSHLCEYLLNKGHEVVCMDNLITGSKDNISHIKSEQFQFVEHNVSEFINLEGELDYILHFASPASPIDYLELSIQTLKVGAMGTHNALGLAKEKKAVFFLASTSEVYGDPLIHPQPEDYWGNVNPIGPRGVYDEAKRFAEAITMAYHRVHGINTKIIRIFNTYGPRMRINDGRAIPNFLKQALTGKDLTVYGEGSQTRSFCYVSDLIEGIYRLLTSDLNNPINIGNPDEMTIKEMADKILQATNSESKITYVPLPEDDPKVRQPDITRAKKYLNWEPVVELDEGLQSTLKYFKEQMRT
ncbi:MAG: SDR family oxidoreductase, partial [Nitrospinaceae bacterium]|nr:SDR family oxidoreductase [Nitrospinaceae bacterium]